MVSTSQLRLLTALSRGEDAEYAPSTGEETDEISYEEAARILDGDDRTPYQALEELAELGVLDREFHGKEYICPACAARSMQFTTGCGACGSLHTVQTELAAHPGCGHAGAEAEFHAAESAREGSCPACGAIVDPSEDLDRRIFHVCQDCGEAVAEPEHALQCRECRDACRPSEAEERVLYRYGFADGGEAWLETQLDAREKLAALLSERGFDVTVDTDLTADGWTCAVDVFGTDELLGERVVGAVHERPDAEAVETLVAAANAVDARSVLVTTSGVLGTDADATVRRREMRVLSPEGGDLVASYDVVGEHDAPTVFELLTSSVVQRLR